MVTGSSRWCDIVLRRGTVVLLLFFFFFFSFVQIDYQALKGCHGRVCHGVDKIGRFM